MAGNESPQKVKFDNNAIPANRPFWITVWVGRDDDTVDFEVESPMSFESESDAADYAKSELGHYGGEIVVFKCTPAIRVHRGAIRTTRIGK